VIIAELLLIMLGLTLLIPASVFFIQVLGSLLPHRKKTIPGGRRPVVAIIVPAHNESLLIARTLHLIGLQLTTNDRLLIVADNCTDDTAKIALACGAEVIERNNSAQRGKGYALDCGVRHLALDPPEVVLFIDGDCEVESGAIDRLAKTCLATGRPVQALYVMRAPENSGLKTRIAGFAWMVKNHVRPLGFFKLGLACQLMGSGMAFPWAAISRATLATGHIVEDLKLGIDLARTGMPPLFCPEAVVMSYFPVTGQGIAEQRKRWEHGHLGMIFGIAPGLIMQALRRGDLPLLALALDLCVPPLALLILMAVTAFAASAAWLAYSGATLPLWLATATLLMSATAVFLAWSNHGRSVISMRDLASAPLYALGKIPLYLGFLVKRQGMWVRTRRDARHAMSFVSDNSVLPSEHAKNPASDGRMVAAATPWYLLPAKFSFRRNIYCLLGLPFDAVNMPGTVEIVRRAVAQRAACFISTPNLNFLIGCLTDPLFRLSVINSDLSIADGMPLVWISRFLGIPIRERVPGAGLFETLRTNVSRPLSVYFFGGPEGAAGTACQRLNGESSGVHCRGYESPGFGSIENMSSDTTIAAINASNADMLVVSLGAKKGQAWIEHNRAQIKVPVICHLGAVVNFVAGSLKRAPSLMQRAGLEWLWRIKEEPGLWQRYFSDGLSLVRLLATRVIPNYLFIHWNTPKKQELDTAAIVILESTSEIVISLRGAWTDENLEPLRNCLSRVVNSGMNLRIDLEHVSYVDAAFLGLILLLHGHQQKIGRKLSCDPLSPQSRQAFTLGCCEFMLDSGRT